MTLGTLLTRIVAATVLLYRPSTRDDPLEYCDADCRETFRQSIAIESQQWVSQDFGIDEFYVSPSNISSYGVGDVVRWQDLSGSEASHNWTVPGGMSLSRFLYVSEDVDGSPVPGTAFVLVPYHGLAGDRPLPLVAWAHGTTGGVRRCAPTNHRALQFEWEGPFSLAQMGYAVVAADYVGQGTDIPQGFMYLSGVSHANDVSHAVAAARRVLGQLVSREWTVVGHSEGGLTAWRTNEREADPGRTIGGFLGAVAMSPALRPLSLVTEYLRRAGDGPVGDTVSIYLLQSLSRLFSSVRIEDYATDMVLDRTPLADQGCLRTGRALFAGLTRAQLFKDESWLAHPDVVGWQRRYAGVGPHPLGGPMLVIQGQNDTITMADVMEEDLNQTCLSFPESSVELLLHPGLGHEPVVHAAMPAVARWLSERFGHQTTPGGCTRKVVGTITARFSNVQQHWAALELSK